MYDDVSNEFFSLPLFPTASPCNTGHVSAQNVGCTCNNSCRCDCTSKGCGHGNSCSCRC